MAGALGGEGLIERTSERTQREARYGIWAAGACTLAVAVAGCGKVLNNDNLQNKIRTQMSGPPFNLTVKSVNCPSNEPVKQGDKFTCT
jgi:hypothetical protein